MKWPSWLWVCALLSVASAIRGAEAAPPVVCPFHVEFHWILRQGDSGFYTYIVYRHGKGMPACTWEQTRAVIWARRGTDLFTNYVMDDDRKGPYPAGQVLRTVFDATWLYAFSKDAVMES